MVPDPVRVTLLIREDCAFCHDAEEVLDRLGTEFAFGLTRVDLDTTEGQTMAVTGGILFPPGIFIDDEAICFGRPSERRLRKALERRSAHAGVPRAGE